MKKWPTVTDWLSYVLLSAGPACISWSKADLRAQFPHNWGEALALTLDPMLTLTVPFAVVVMSQIRAFRRSLDAHERKRFLRRRCAVAWLLAIVLWQFPQPRPSITLLLTAVGVATFLSLDFQAAAEADSYRRRGLLRVLFIAALAVSVLVSAMTFARINARDAQHALVDRQTLPAGVHLIRTCVAMTSTARGYTLSSSSSCTIPNGVVITRLSLDAVFDDGGHVDVESEPTGEMSAIVKGQRLLEVANSLGRKEEHRNFSNTSLPLRPGDNFALMVVGRNAIDERGEPVGVVFAKATLRIYGTVDPDFYGTLDPDGLPNGEPPRNK
jgi:hypothetical protein